MKQTTIDKWEPIITEYQSSGLSVMDFCRLNAYSASYFRKMVRWFSGEGETAVSDCGSTFCPVTVVSEKVSSIQVKVDGHLIEFDEDIPDHILSVMVRACRA